MPEKFRALFKYENARYISWNNLLKILNFTQIRWRVGKGDVLGWTLLVTVCLNLGWGGPFAYNPYCSLVSFCTMFV